MTIEQVWHFTAFGYLPLPKLFGAIEKHRGAVGIASYSLSQTSLEQIFNQFAAQQEEETGDVAGLVNRRHSSS